MPFAMDPGHLRNEVILQAPGGRTSDGGGGFTQRWRARPGGLRWARIRPLEGNERLRAMQTQANATHEVTIRYESGVTAAMRFVHEDRVLKIVSPPVDPDERHEWLQLLCREET